MNKKKMFVKAISIIACLQMVFGMSTGFQAAAQEGSVYTAYDTYSLNLAIQNANDGDVIMFHREITIQDIGNPGKKVVLRRMSEDARLVTYPGVDVTIQNITFDGGGIKSNYPLLTIQGDFSIKDCTFQNCGQIGNTSSSGSAGGAIQIQSGKGSFVGCDFIQNSAVSGGHIAIAGNSIVTMNECILKEGFAGSGGAIDIWGNASCTIDSCVITENEAGDFGGGIANASHIIIRNTKLFNNKAVNGGADIGNTTRGTVVLEDSLEQLIELFKEDEIIPKGWVSDYDFEVGIYIPDVEPTMENSLLKLDFEYKQPEEAETEQPTPPEESEKPSIPEDIDKPTGGEQDNEQETPPQDSNSDEQKPSEPETGESEQKPDNDTPSTPSNSTVNNSTTDNSTTDNSSTNTNTNTTNTTTTNTSNSTTGDTITNNSSSSSSDNSTSSNHTSNTTDNSRYSSTSDSNNTSTVNNYYPQQQTGTQPSNQQGVQTIVIPVGGTGSGEPIQQTITIEGNQPEGTVSGSSDDMTINVNVNTDAANTTEQQTAPVQQNGLSWYQAIVLCLLSGILVCLLKRR